MGFLNKIRIPFREDSYFGIIFLIFFLVPLVFSFFLYENFETIKYIILTFLLGAAVFYWTVRFWQQKENNSIVLRGHKWFFFSLLGFLLWSFIVSLFAWDTSLAFFGFFPRFTNGFLFYLVFVLLVFCVSLLEREKLLILLKLLAITSGLVAIWGLLQSVGVGYFMGFTEVFFNRAPSFLGNANFAAMYVAALLPAQIYFIEESKLLINKIIFGLLSFFGLWSVIALTSRGAMGALLIGLLLGFTLSVLAKKKRLAVSFLTALAISFVLFSFFWNLSRPNSIKNTISFQEANVQQRVSVWQLAAESIYKRPILGTGLSNFQLMFERERTSTNILNVGFYDDPHNIVLLLASTGGIPLALLFLSFIGIAVYFGFFDLFKNKNEVSLVIIAGLASWLFAAMFNPVAIPCFIILAVFLPLLFVNENFVILVRKNYLVEIPFILISVILIFWSLAFLVAGHLFYFGVKNYKQGNYKAANQYLSKASNIYPFVFLHNTYFAASSILSEQSLDGTNAALNRALSLHPEWSRTTTDMANLYYLLYYKTKDKAYIPTIQLYMSKSLFLNPNSQYEYFAASQFAMAFGQADSAEKLLKKSIVLYGQNPKAWLFLAKIYQQKGDRDGMLYALENMVKYAPEEQSEYKLLLTEARKQKNVSKFNFKIVLGLGVFD